MLKVIKIKLNKLKILTTVILSVVVAIFVYKDYFDLLYISILIF